jgi:hypothetical protein
MTSSTAEFVTYRLRNATVHNWPFPHFFVENVFPQDIYDKIVSELAEKQDFVEGAFRNRRFATEVDLPDVQFMNGREFTNNVVKIFPNDFLRRFPTGSAQLTNELRLVRDCQGYKIGPHTDAKWKMLSLLFYMPSRNTDYWSNEEYGTRLYIPKDRQFTCEGGPHHGFENFDEVASFPFRPNCCLGFWKTNRSFHGVPPIPVQFQRDVLLFNVYEQQLTPDSHGT